MSLAIRFTLRACRWWWLYERRLRLRRALAPPPPPLVAVAAATESAVSAAGVAGEFTARAAAAHVTAPAAADDRTTAGDPSRPDGGPADVACLAIAAAAIDRAQPVHRQAADCQTSRPLHLMKSGSSRTGTFCASAFTRRLRSVVSSTTSRTSTCCAWSTPVRNGVAMTLDPVPGRERMRTNHTYPRHDWC